MNTLCKNIPTVAVFLIGLLGFIFGEFIISSTLLAAASITVFWKNKRPVQESSKQPVSTVFIDLKPVTSFQAAAIFRTISWPGTIGNIALHRFS